MISLVPSASAKLSRVLVVVLLALLLVVMSPDVENDLEERKV